MIEIGFTILIGVVFWFMGFMTQRSFRHSSIQVPFWVALLCGSSSNDIEPTGFFLQFLGVGFTLWVIILIFTTSPGEYRGIMVVRGIVVLLVLDIVLRIILSRSSKNE